jgi:hypothetical protein
MTSPARRRMVRRYRLMQSWPLLYLGAAIVGFIICALGLITARQTWIRFGLWFTVPFFLLLGWLVMVLAISAVVNTGILVWRLVKR